MPRRLQSTPGCCRRSQVTTGCHGATARVVPVEKEAVRMRERTHAHTLCLRRLQTAVLPFQLNDTIVTSVLDHKPLSRSLEIYYLSLFSFCGGVAASPLNHPISDCSLMSAHHTHGLKGAELGQISFTHFHHQNL